MKGTSHDRTSLILTPLAAFTAHTIAPSTTLLAIAGYTIGWLWLSPDLDLPQSRPSKRWGLLRWVWIPYQETHRHRGFSHLPAIGSTCRLAYVVAPVWAICLVLGYGFNINWRDMLTLWAGIEGACLLHLLCDYCPGLRKL